MRTNMKKFLALVLALSMMFSLSVTTRADEESEDLGLIITPLSLELQVGNEPTPVQVTIFSGDPTDVTFRWNSEDETIVRITGNGTSARVTPMQAGSTTIEVFAEKGSVILGHDTIPVTVKSAVEPIRVQAVGKTSLNMSIGETATLGAKVSGGSGEYTYAWNSNGSVEIESYDDTQGMIYAARGGAGRVGLTVIDANDKGNFATAYWDVTVAESAAPVQVSLNKYGMSLRVGGTDTLQVSASGGSGEFTYRWHTDARIVDVTTNGASAVVTGVKPGTDTIGVDVIDSKTGEAQLLECVVEVLGNSANFDVAEKATVGGGLDMNTIANAIANAYRSQFGTTLGFGASVQMASPSSKIGSICMQDGTPVY
ncbi:MAG: Ig-like domain-containing protein, partial [Oscillospiraceae bacterium]|nr:Ig-like domain-containing protein [Oscillospiraceae bacterium]